MGEIPGSNNTPVEVKNAELASASTARAASAYFCIARFTSRRTEVSAALCFDSGRVSHARPAVKSKSAKLATTLGLGGMRRELNCLQRNLSRTLHVRFPGRTEQTSAPESGARLNCVQRCMLAASPNWQRTARQRNTRMNSQSTSNPTGQPNDETR